MLLLLLLLLLWFLIQLAAVASCFSYNEKETDWLLNPETASKFFRLELFDVVEQDSRLKIPAVQLHCEVFLNVFWTIVSSCLFVLLRPKLDCSWRRIKTSLASA